LLEIRPRAIDQLLLLSGSVSTYQLNLC